MKQIVISESAKSKINNKNYSSVIKEVSKSKSNSGNIGNIIYKI